MPEPSPQRFKEPAGAGEEKRCFRGGQGGQRPGGLEASSSLRQRGGEGQEGGSHTVESFAGRLGLRFHPKEPRRAKKTAELKARWSSPE